MASPLVNPRFLAVNPEAQQHHSEGLTAALGGNYPEAHDAFSAALAVLSGEVTFDSMVQSAAIIRNDGFTHAREGITTQDPALLDEAAGRVRESLEITAPFVAGISFRRIVSPLPHETPKQGRRELLSEHGATLSLLGRIATIKEVASGIDTRGDSEAAQESRMLGQQPYGLAHDILRRGNNGYYLVSNAMVGARQERLNGRLIHMGVWLSRAAIGMLWTATHDASNIKATLRTVGSRIYHLRTYEAARQSVLSRP